MKIRIDSSYKTVYEVETDGTGFFLFKFFNKKDLINALQELKPSFKIRVNAYYSTIEDRFNSL